MALFLRSMRVQTMKKIDLLIISLSGASLFFPMRYASIIVRRPPPLWGIMSSQLTDTLSLCQVYCIGNSQFMPTLVVCFFFLPHKPSSTSQQFNQALLLNERHN